MVEIGAGDQGEFELAGAGKIRAVVGDAALIGKRRILRGGEVDARENCQRDQQVLDFGFHGFFFSILFSDSTAGPGRFKFASHAGSGCSAFQAFGLLILHVVKAWSGL
jgi:hypothetical protein